MKRRTPTKKQLRSFAGSRHLAGPLALLVGMHAGTLPASTQVQRLGSRVVSNRGSRSRTDFLWLRGPSLGPFQSIPHRILKELPCLSSFQSCSPQVSDRTLEYIYIVPRVAKYIIAVVAQQPSDVPGGVIVVYATNILFSMATVRYGLVAYSTLPLLGDVHVLPFRVAYSIFAIEVSFVQSNSLVHPLTFSAPTMKTV